MSKLIRSCAYLRRSDSYCPPSISTKHVLVVLHGISTVLSRDVGAHPRRTYASFQAGQTWVTHLKGRCSRKYRCMTYQGCAYHPYSHSGLVLKGCVSKGKDRFYDFIRTCFRRVSMTRVSSNECTVVDRVLFRDPLADYDTSSLAPYSYSLVSRIVRHLLT